MTPTQGSAAVRRDTIITLTLSLPDGLASQTVDGTSVRLFRQSDGAPMPARVQYDQANAQLRIEPKGYLDADTTYELSVADAIQSLKGTPIEPFRARFTTGRAGGPQPGPDGIAFDTKRDIVHAPAGTLFSGVQVGPDRQLYASTLTGTILRQPILADGALGPSEAIDTIVKAVGPRAIIGMAFDPQGSPDNPILWVGHSDPQYTSRAKDWSGRISRLSGDRLQYMEDYVINLPHSYKDHMVNSLSFGPDGGLYILVGSNSAMGSPDRSWGWRPERLLSAALLRLDVAAVAAPPLDAKTAEGGRYDPYAPGAPLTLYATGLRNAFDLAWHSNGALYVPTNGSASGGTAPATSANLANDPACIRRGYSGTGGIKVKDIENQNDWLYRVEAGGYYGHPNPQRCEWIAHGGNPTAAEDPGQIDGYPVGTLPDPNWRGAAYTFGPNHSANGIIEYHGAAFGGRLRGALLVAEYGSNDIVALWPGGPKEAIAATAQAIPGLSVLSKPLDLAEDPQNGNIYVVEFGPPGMITLLRPVTETVAHQRWR